MSDNGDDLDEYDDTPEGPMSSFSAAARKRGVGWVRIVLLICVAIAAIALIVGYAAGFGKAVWFFAVVIWALTTIVWLADSYATGSRAGRERPLGVPLAAAATAFLSILLLTFVTFGQDEDGGDDRRNEEPSTPVAGEVEEGETAEEGTSEATRPSGTRTPRATPTRSTRTPTGTPTSGGQTYTVQAGDTLSGIATQFGVSVEELMEANDLTSDLIDVGQELIIP